MAAEQLDTIIGAQVELTGSLKNDGPIQIHGHINGDVSSQSTVFVAEGATVTGPITAKNVDVAGEVHGSITAEVHIELQPKSIVRGDITTKQLSVKPGAIFVGSSNMELPHTAVSEEVITKHKPRLEIE